MNNLHLFFATRDDLISNIKELELAMDIYYVLTGQFVIKSTEQYSSLLEIPNMGVTKAKERLLCDAYLVLPKNVKVKFQRVFVRKKGIQYAYDQGKNTKSIVLRLGGLYQNQSLLAGSIDTIGETNISIYLFKNFSKLLTKNFTKVKDYSVGPEAMTMLKAGKRLVTMHVNQPKEYDLVL